MKLPVELVEESRRIVADAEKTHIPGHGLATRRMLEESAQPMRVAIFNDTAVHGHYGCLAVMRTLTENLTSRGLEIELLWPVSKDWRGYRSRISKRPIDLIIVNGEGTIHHTNRNARAMALCSLGEFAKQELGIRSILLNATIAELHSEAFSKVLEFDRIYVRETLSLRNLTQQGIKAGFVPDLSVFSSALIGVEGRCSGPLVTDSVVRENSVSLQRFAEKSGLDFHRMVAKRKPKILDRVISRIPEGIIFPETRPSHVLRRSVDPLCGFYARLSGAEFVVTGRFHTVMLCLAAKTPVLALESNTPKISAVFQDVFGNTERLIDPSILDNDGLRACRNLAPYSQSELCAIDEYLEKGFFQMGYMFDELALNPG